MPASIDDPNQSPFTNPPDAEELMFGELLSYFREEIDDPDERAAIEGKLRDDPVWRAHWNSIQSLHLEWNAALQDAEELQCFVTPDDFQFCWAVATNEQNVFLPLLEGENFAGEWSRREWLAHAQNCPFCRRKWRNAQARFETERLAKDIPALRGKVLLRDWLIEPRCEKALEKVPAKLQDWIIEKEGLTRSVRNRHLFVEKMKPVARRLLVRVLRSDELLSPFLEYLQTDTVIADLRKVPHVSSELGRVLADFLHLQRHAEVNDVRAMVTQQIIIDVLYEVVVNQEETKSQGKPEHVIWAGLKAEREKDQNPQKNMTWGKDRYLQEIAHFTPSSNPQLGVICQTRLNDGYALLSK